MSLKGLIFDLDGVIVFTDRIIIKHGNRWLMRKVFTSIRRSITGCAE